MKTKKILIGLLCAAMTASCLVGCGGGSDSGSSTANNSNTAGDTSSEADGSGELATLRIMGQDYSTILGDQEVAFSDWVNGDSKLWEKMTSDLAERGIKLELDLIRSDQFQTVSQTSLAAGMNYDIFSVSALDTATRLDLAEKGTIIPVNDIWENHSDGTAKEYYTSGRGALSVSRTSLADGKMYWLSEIVDGDYNGIDTGSPYAPAIRQDWLEALGMELPTTTEEFKAALQAFQDNDVNGSGEKDEVASFSLKSFDSSVAQWFGLGTDITYIDPETHKITSPWYQTDQVQAYINYMKSLVDAGLVDTSDQGSQKTADNKISATCIWGAISAEQSITVQDGALPPAYQIVVCEAMDGVQPRVPIQNGYMLTPIMAFTSQCTNLDAAGAYLDYVCTPEFEELTEYGIEGYTFTRNEDGSKTKIKDTEGNLEVQRMSISLALWGNAAAPRMYTCDRAAELEMLREAGYPDRADMIDKIYNTQECWIDQNPSQCYAPETEEELTRTNEITTDLTTYSEELLMKLILGQQSMDDWDTYMADLQRLGLDELIEINQARYDRAQGN